MPLLPARWTFKMDGAEKKETKHWFGIRYLIGGGIGFMRLIDTSGYDDAICGEKCALEALASFMAAVKEGK